MEYMRGARFWGRCHPRAALRYARGVAQRSPGILPPGDSSALIHPLHRFSIRASAFRSEATEDDAVKLRVCVEKSLDLIRRDGRGAVQRKPVRAGADRRECDGADPLAK